MNQKIKISDFSPHLFWDVKPGSLDIEKNQQFITERVIQRGNRNDWKILEETYKREQIKSQVKKIDWLSDKDMAYVHLYFDISYNEMRCYIIKQSTHYHWL
ncbi:MAG: hypothetical protein R2796_09595 [Chitinophagaceae bacterium]|nr:hypothetical protein [Chitinophagaceae bacterium]